MPNDWSEWWWNVALDGVLGAIIGGGVTLAVLYLGLRHERRKSDLQLVEDRAQALVAETSAIASAAMLFVARRWPRWGGWKVDLTARICLDWSIDMNVLAGQANRKSLPNLKRILDALADKAVDETVNAFSASRDFDALGVTLATAVGVLTNVTTDARHYEGMKDGELSQFLAEIAAGLAFGSSNTDE